MDRRQFLASLGAAGGVAGAGCLGDISDTVAGGGSSEEKKFRLLGIDIFNRDSEAHTVHTLVRRNGEIVHWSSHHLKPAHGGEPTIRGLDTDWPDSPAPFDVSVRLDGSKSWDTTDFKPEDDCTSLNIEVEENGSLDLVVPMSCESAEQEYNQTTT